MITRVLAWAVVIAAIWGAYSYAKGWSSPWALSSVNPITSVMPKLPNGCGKECRE